MYGTPEASKAAEEVVKDVSNEEAMSRLTHLFRRLGTTRNVVWHSMRSNGTNGALEVDAYDKLIDALDMAVAFLEWCILNLERVRKDLNFWDVEFVMSCYYMIDSTREFDKGYSSHETMEWEVLEPLLMKSDVRRASYNIRGHRIGLKAKGIPNIPDGYGITRP